MKRRIALLEPNVYTSIIRGMCSIRTLVICTTLALFAATTSQAHAEGCPDSKSVSGQTQPTDETVYFATDRQYQSQSVDTKPGPLIYGSAIASFKEETPHRFFDGMESPLEWKTSAPQPMTIRSILLARIPYDRHGKLSVLGRNVRPRFRKLR
jgi:hypothetical protein